MSPAPAAQSTIQRSVSLDGIGLHTGNPVTLTFHPAEPGCGRVFVRTDLPGNPQVHPGPERVSQTSRGTVIQENGVEVYTVEHVLASLAGMGVDNCRIELTASEPPIMDGSAQAFVEAILQAGIEAQAGTTREPLVLSQLLMIEQPGKSIVGWPYSGLKLSYCLGYDHSWLQPQRVELEIDQEVFITKLARARTFCFEEEIAYLKSRGLAQGGTLDNALVIAKDGFMNGPLRFPEELVYHKMLDFIGDLALLGCPVQGQFVAWRSGHEMNARLTQRFKNQQIRESLLRRRKEKVIIQAKEIEELLPHRYPMLLIDRILDLEEGKRIVGIKNVTINEQFFQGHFPGYPIMPGVLIVEAMAQCGGVLLIKSFPDAKHKMVLFMSIDNVKFRKPVLPGDQLRFEMTVEKIRSKIAKIHGNAFVDEDLVCEADLTSTLVDR